MSAPSDAATGTPVWHFDGETAARHERLFVVDGATFRLDDGEAQGETLQLADLVARDPVGGAAIYGLKGRPGWKIGFTGDLPPALFAVLPRTARYGGVIDRVGLWPAVAVFGVIAAIIVYAFLQVPAAVARIVPPAIERQLGDAMVGDFGRRLCDGPGGREALTTLTGRLGALPGDVDIQVANIPLVNAVTLPGGRIIIFDGLLKGAQSPDEVAGVVAHELGHVAHRDVLETLLRQLGLSVLLGGLDGNIGGYTNALLATAYSRGAEARADDYAIQTLNENGVSPRDTAAFFDRLGGGEPKNSRVSAVLGYLSSHPVSATRSAKFAAAADKRKDAYSPALDAQSWAQLKTICSSDPDLPKDPGFTLWGYNDRAKPEAKRNR